MSEDKLTVATVLKPQGIRGEIKVKVHLDSAEDLKELKSVYIDGIQYRIMSVRAQGDCAYVILRGVADRNTAELFRGKDIQALREDLPLLPEGRFYIADLIGCKVITEKGAEIGCVISVTPARTDIYTLCGAKGEVSFAAADGVIEEVDVENKIITVNYKRFKEVSV